MKNTLIIDIDTERDTPVKIGKPDNFKQPETKEEAKKVILDDITCVCETLCMLIKLADDNNHHDKNELIKASIFHLNKLNENNA